MARGVNEQVVETRPAAEKGVGLKVGERGHGRPAVAPVVVAVKVRQYETLPS